MNENLIKVLNEFRKMKIDFDIERFKLMSYQLENIINKYEVLIKTRKDIQEEYFTTLENIKN